MASSISAGTTSATALVHTADTSGALQLATNNGTVALTIDTSQRTAFVAGTAALPAITTSGDTNTGIFFPAADTIAFSEGGAEAMRIDSSGNVGIGTSSPSVKFQVDHSSDVAAINASGGGVTLKMSNSSANDVLLRMTNNSSNFWDIRNLTSGSALTFGYNGTESMRIDSSGNLLSANGAIYFTSAQYRSNVASSQLQFINNSAGVSLAVNGTSWGSLSDERDKEIIEPIADAVSKVASLRSVIGRYKVDDADKRRAFLIAQDVKAVLPEAVTELEDEQQTLILQYTEVIPLLVAAINELNAKVTALEEQVLNLGVK